MRYKTSTFLVSVAILIVQVVFGQQGRDTAANTPPTRPTNPPSAELDTGRRIEALERRVEQLSTRLDADLRAANMRFEAVTHSTDRAFNVLALLGAFGSFLGGLIVVFSWLRARKSDKLQRSDYERERDFYEKRVLATEEHSKTSYEKERDFYESRITQLDQRNKESHQIGLDLTRQFASRDAGMAHQQFQLGDKVLAHSGDILSQQVESITKLGGVIELVKKTFDMQLTRVSDVDKLLTRLGETDAIVASFSKHFRGQYGHVSDLMLTFRRHSRMDWTRLTEHEITLASRALTIFDTIPRNVLDGILQEDDGKHKFEVAQLNQLLGVSAFYTNDIDAAARYLEQGLQIYGKDDAPAENLFPQAFCSHFLGLVEKNWCHQDRPLEANLAASRQHLEDAARRLRSREGEFLTPVTLAEVLSYSEQTWQDAHTYLDEIIDRFEHRKAAQQSIDANQNALFGRALLLKGNLYYLQGDQAQALVWFSKARDHDPKNPYAILSIAQATDSQQPSERKDRFAEGLQSLIASGALQKRENAARLLAVAWAIIAARAVNDAAGLQKFLHDIDSASSYVRPVGGRAPLFFCPITKKLVDFEQLRSNVKSYLAGPASTPPPAQAA